MKRAVSKRSLNTMDMTQGPIFSNIVKFTIPLILTGTLQLLYNAADIIVVGKYGSPNALAAVSSTGALINLIVNVFMGLSIGSSVLVAQYFGAGRRRDMSEAVHTSIAIALISGFVVGIFGFFATRTMLEWMSSPEDVIDLSALYVKIFFLGSPANMIYNFGASILRAVGDTKRPLYYLMFSGVINVVMNLVFVIGFHLDVAGVALATIISQLVSAILIIICLLRSEGAVKLYIKKIKIHWKKLGKILAVGLPAGIQGSVFSISNVIIQSSINGFGVPAIMGGNGAAANIEGFIYNAMNSVYQAAITFTGQNYGAEKFKRIKAVMFECVAIVFTVGFGLGALAKIFSTQLLGLYTDNPQEVAFGIVRMNVICLTYFTCGLMDVMVGMLRGIGRSLIPTIDSILCVCGFRIVWIFTYFASYKATGASPEECLRILYISYPISWVMAFLVHLACFMIFYRIAVKKSREGKPLNAEPAGEA